MSLTYSSLMPLGTIAPDFNLQDVTSDNDVSLQELKSEIATVIMFICNHCPYVIHIQDKLIEIAHHYMEKNIQFIAINSNDVLSYPEDSPQNMKARAKSLDYPFVYLFDENQSVAKAYQAACTPEFYIFDHNLACIYRGRFDCSTPGNGETVTGDDLRQALNDIMRGNPVNPDQHQSQGCSIKWKN